ncbi:hypothetical protein [Brucella pseudogrignonensis]|jgi:hypothetical protein|uniref:hypothetical protein n=1 Tax=Brucella pseudogrignonensis TaxID=419475 RepID=UPI0038CF43CC
MAIVIISGALRVIAPTAHLITLMFQVWDPVAYQLIQGGADLGSVKEMLAVSKELAADQAMRSFSVAISRYKSDCRPVFSTGTSVLARPHWRGSSKFTDLSE